MLVNAGAPGISVRGIDLAPRHTRECQENKQSTMIKFIYTYNKYKFDLHQIEWRRMWLKSMEMVQCFQ